MPTRGMTSEQALAKIEHLAAALRAAASAAGDGPQPMQVPPTSSWSLIIDGSVIGLRLFSLGSSKAGMPSFSPGWEKNREHWFLSDGVDLNTELDKAGSVQLQLNIDCSSSTPCQSLINDATAVLASGATFQLYALTQLSTNDWIAGGPPSLGSGYNSYYFVTPGGAETAPRLLFDVPTGDGGTLARLSWITKERYTTIAGGFTADAASIPTNWPTNWWYYASSHYTAALDAPRAKRSNATKPAKAAAVVAKPTKAAKTAKAAAPVVVAKPAKGAKPAKPARPTAR